MCFPLLPPAPHILSPSAAVDNWKYPNIGNYRSHKTSNRCPPHSLVSLDFSLTQAPILLPSHTSLFFFSLSWPLMALIIIASSTKINRWKGTDWDGEGKTKQVPLPACYILYECWTDKESSVFSHKLGQVSWDVSAGWGMVTHILRCHDNQPLSWGLS